ncbi:response regulator [Paenibacillus ginsengarvi]|nr:response regulator [Paenibacillus ginsengarvi]
MAKILLVDHTSGMRKYVREILEGSVSNHIYIEASNGLEAINQYLNHSPDLVIMEIILPYLDGIEALKKILDFHSEAKVIIISAFFTSIIEKEVLELGARFYLRKPFQNANIIKCVQMLIYDTQLKDLSHG